MLLLLLSIACSENGLNSFNDANQSESDSPPIRNSDDSGEGADDSGQDTGIPNDSDDPDEPPTGDPPEIFLNDCPNSISVTMAPEEIYVKPSDPNIESATVTSSVSGWFHVFDTTIAESGAAQQNESGFVRISNGGNPSGAPVWSTCSDEWIVRDADNSGTPAGSKIYIGTFWLEEGANQLTLEHVCNLVAVGECASELNQVSGHMCEDSNSNSVHIKADGLCVIHAE